MLKNADKTMDKIVDLCKAKGFVFTPSQTWNYLFQTTSFVQDRYGIVSDTNIDDLDCYIYDKNGQVIYTITNIGQVNATINLTYGQNYYIKIYNYSQRACDYKITTTWKRVD